MGISCNNDGTKKADTGFYNYWGFDTGCAMVNIAFICY